MYFIIMKYISHVISQHWLFDLNWQQEQRGFFPGQNIENWSTNWTWHACIAWASLAKVFVNVSIVRHFDSTHHQILLTIKLESNGIFKESKWVSKGFLIWKAVELPNFSKQTLGSTCLGGSYDVIRWGISSSILLYHLFKMNLYQNWSFPMNNSFPYQSCDWQ